MRGGRRDGAGRPKGTYKEESKRRAKRQVCAFDDEWSLIDCYAKMVKYGDREACERFISQHTTE